MKILAISLGVVLLLGAGAQLSYNWYQAELDTPVTPGDRSPVALHVDQGEPTDQIASDLAAKRLIPNQQIFIVYVRLSGTSYLQAGDYELTRSMTIREIVQAMGHSRPIQIKVQVREGLRATDIAQVVAQAGLGSPEDYLTAAGSPEWTDDFLARAPGNGPFEGFLFPETYYLNKGATARDLVRKQLDQFAAEVTPDLRSQAIQPAPGRLAQSLFNILILASMVEREANRSEDRPQVCSVYYNRLDPKKGGTVLNRLQVEPTVLYAAGDWKANIPAAKTIDSPYNTFTHSGMPPGPISNPGLDSIKACIHPATTNYLYYFTDKKGDMHFERTLDQFNADINEYGV